MTDDKKALWTKDFILITIINFFLFCSFQMHPAALPPYVKSLGAQDHLLGWVTGIATLSILMIRPVAGLILDRAGRKTFFLLGMAIMLVANLALYLLPVVGAVLVIRFIHGLGWGAAGTANNTIVADYIPKERFGEGMGYFSLSASLAMAVSPALALSLSPGPMFMTSAAFAALAFTLACRLRYKKVIPPPPGTRGTLAPYERKALMPALLICLINITYGALITFLAVYAAERGITNIGPFFIVLALSMMATRPALGKLIDRKGFGIIIVPGSILVGAGLLLLSFSHSLLMFLLSAALYAIGQGGLHTSTQSLAVLNSPRDRVGAANATFFTGFDAGIGIGAVLSGALAARYGYSHMFQLLLVFPVLCACIYLVASKHKS